MNNNYSSFLNYIDYNCNNIKYFDYSYNSSFSPNYNLKKKTIVSNYEPFFDGRHF